MLLIPAIDVKDGQCVRLRQGRMDDVTVFDPDPAAMATRWLAAGAERIHVVDLDGATAGVPVNRDAIARVIRACGAVPVQVGGGIRDEEGIDAYLELGAAYVIIGTRAIAEPHFVADVAVEFPERIIIGLDTRDGRVATDGWSKLSNHDVTDLARQFERDGVAAIIHTDIARDGMLSGLNVEATRRLAREVTIPVIASGGVSNLADVEALCAAEEDGVTGAVIGRALYEGSLDLATALAFVAKRK